MINTYKLILIALGLYANILCGHNDHEHKSNPNDTLQANGAFSEFYVDGPWRMSLYDTQGNLNNIPITFYLHDADARLTGSLNVDYIDIQLKSANDSSFGSVITFNNLSPSDFEALFVDYSESDSNMDIKEFKLTSLINSHDHTIDFNDYSGLLTDYVSIDQKYWHFTLNLTKDVLEGTDPIIDIKATIGYSGVVGLTSEEHAIRVFRSEYEIPKQKNYFRGDMHLHSMYTENSAEFGLPLRATKTAAKLIGLDWITTTDHTSDFDNYGPNIEHNWDRIQNDALKLNNEDSSLIYIAGQEVSLNNNANQLVHLLAYPKPNSPFDLPFLGDGKGDLSPTETGIEDVCDILKNIDAFSYAAHPFATEDKLPTVPVGGGVWNLGHKWFPANSDNFPKVGGEIICNNWAGKSDLLIESYDRVIRDGLVGAQIWNVRTSLTTTGNPLDPWGLTGNSAAFDESDTTSFKSHIKRFRQGQEVVNSINQIGLKYKNQDSSYTQWKLYYGAGADAHGSFNYSNTDDFLGLGEISDNAVGKLSTIVYCPKGMGTHGKEVLSALKNGNSSISDGPILNLGLSIDGPNNINNVNMGSDCVLKWNEGVKHFFNLHFTTSPEFGQLRDIKIYIGSENGENLYNWNDYDTSSIDKNHSISLTQIMLSLYELNDSLLYNRYFYIRAECQTKKNYEKSIYGKTVDFYHAFTNPIWFKFLQENKNGFEYYLYPNPSSKSLFLHLNGGEQQEILIELIDISGRRINYKKVDILGFEKINLSNWIKSLSAGEYFIRLSNEFESKAEKIMIHQ